jgi:hypothetical protein
MRNIIFSMIIPIMLTPSCSNCSNKIREIDLQNWSLRSSDNFYFINNSILFTAYNLDNLNTGFHRINLDSHQNKKFPESKLIIEAPILKIKNSNNGIFVEIGIKESELYPEFLYLFEQNKNSLKKIEISSIFSVDSNYSIIENEEGSQISVPGKAIQLDYSLFNIIGGVPDYIEYRNSTFNFLTFTQNILKTYKINLDTLNLIEKQYYIGNTNFNVKKIVSRNDRVFLLTYEKTIYEYCLSDRTLKEIINVNEYITPTDIDLTNNYFAVNEYLEGFTNLKIFELKTGNKIIDIPADDYIMTNDHLIIAKKNKITLFDHKGNIVNKKEFNINGTIKDLLFFSDDLTIFKSSDNYLVVASNST